MYEGSKNLFENENLELSSLTAASTLGRTLDFFAANQSRGPIIRVVGHVVEEAVGGKSITLTLNHSADNETFTSFYSKTIELKDLKLKNSIIDIVMPADMKQYVKCSVVADGTFTSGKIFATVVPRI